MKCMICQGSVPRNSPVREELFFLFAFLYRIIMSSWMSKIYNYVNVDVAGLSVAGLSIGEILNGHLPSVH